MEVFGMASSPSPGRSNRSSPFDYLRDATTNKNKNNIRNSDKKHRHNNSKNNDSVSFLLDTSAIARSSTPTDLSLASNKQKKHAFYTLHDTAVSEFLSPRSPSNASRTSNTNRSKTNNQNDNYSLNVNDNASSHSKNSKNRRHETKFRTPTAQSAAASFRASLPMPSLRAEIQASPTANQSPSATPGALARPKVITRRSVSSTTLVTPAGVGKRQPMIPQTPAGFWTTNTEPKTFVNGLLSPFSPLLHSTLHNKASSTTQKKDNNLATIDDNSFGINKDDDRNQPESPRRSTQVEIQDQRREYLQYVSLQPCRKVSVVVRVTALDSRDEGASRCIFPHYKDEVMMPSYTDSEAVATNDGGGFTTPNGKGGGTVNNLGVASKALTSPTHRRDVVVVNPTAFGKYIPSKVTLETAKMVAQVSNIASEDWARLYEFHHVMWPRQGGHKSDSDKTSCSHNRDRKDPKDLASTYDTMDSLSRAVVQDLLAEQQSSLLISLGHECSCFGTSPNPGSSGENGSSIGLWPKIMNQCAAMLETKGVVRLTMVEILEPSGGQKAHKADSFRDLLAPPDQKPASIFLRHPDMKGAVIVGLCEAEIDSMPALLEALARSRERRAQRRRTSASSGTAATGLAATALIGTLHYWEHAVSFELNKPSNATVTCVELSSNHHNDATDGTAKTTATTTDNAAPLATPESVACRQSAVTLGHALRQLLLQEAYGTEKSLGLSTSELAPVVSYRESTLTKILQRPMESCKIVLVASISQLSRDYEHTVFTLDYLRRLLKRPGHTSESPYRGRYKGNYKNKATTPKTAKIDNRTNPNSNLSASFMSSPEAIDESKGKLSKMAHDPKYLEQLVTDPRQRLARFFDPSPSKKKLSKPWSNVIERMEDSQKSTRGTPTAISLNGPDATSTIGSPASHSYADPRGTPTEESRQVVESPGSVGQPRQPWQPDEEEDGDEERSHEYSSEEEIERQLLASARLKNRTIQIEISRNRTHSEQQWSDEKGNDEGDSGEEPDQDSDNPINQAVEEDGAIEVDVHGVPTSDPSSDPPTVANASSGPLDLDLDLDEDDTTSGLHRPTDYDLPDTPVDDFVDTRTYEDSAQSLPPDMSRPSASSQSFNYYASSYSAKFTEITNQREEFKSRVTQLQEELRKVSEHRNTTVEQYEAQIENLYVELDEAANTKRELETVADQVVSMKANRDQEIETFQAEREELQRTVDSLRNELSHVSESQKHESRRHQEEIDEFQSKLDKAMETQKEIEEIADDAVNAHRTQEDETRVLASERDDLQATIESLQSTVTSLEHNQVDYVSKYQQEIRELNAKLEETSKEKRSLQQETDDAHFKLETQSEKLRQLNLERDELHSNLKSIKGSAKKASGDHDEYQRRFKHEIQQLHTKLDDTHSDKLKVEKIADEVRFVNGDLERRVKTLQDELSSSRANTHRLEGIRREEQETIRKMNVELRRKDSERLDTEHFKNELERLKRHKDHLESLVTHRKVESSAALQNLEQELAEAKRNNLKLEEELSALRTELSLSQIHNEELGGKLRSALDANSQLSHQLSEKEDNLERLQSGYQNLESLRDADKNLIDKLNEELRNREAASLDIEQLRHKLSRLRQDRDHLQHLVDSRKTEYDRSMEEKANEVSAYFNQVETLKKDLKKASAIDQRYRTDAEAQLRSLQASESNLIQKLRQRDEKIDRLKDEMSSRMGEIDSLRERATSASQVEQEVIVLRERLTKLEMTLEITLKEREEAVEKAKSDSRSHKSVLDELERSKDEIHRYKNVLQDMNEELDQRQEDSLKAKERLFQMESILRKFKEETKERVNTLIDHEKNSKTILERTRYENRGLRSNLENLSSRMERIRHERDICFRSLKDGRKKLSELSSKNPSVQLDDLLPTQMASNQRRSPLRRDLANLLPTQIAPNQRKSPRRTEPRTDPRPSRPPVESITARELGRTLPEIYVSGYHLGSPIAHAGERAEEIAACVAQSAKNSLEENFEEVSQLRSQIHRLADERSEQVASLKAKVRNLEKQLSHERVGQSNGRSEEMHSLKIRIRNLESQLSYDRVGNRTPVMGSSARRSRKQNYFVDWDEKHWDENHVI